MMIYLVVLLVCLAIHLAMKLRTAERTIYLLFEWFIFSCNCPPPNPQQLRDCAERLRMKGMM